MAVLERMVTVSRAAPGTSLEAVFAIIRAAHARNGLAGLTGGLIFLDGSFVQVLEGPPGPLAEARARIARDPRHGAWEQRARERALCRLFPDQPLALRTRACLDPRVLEDFGYVAGFPAQRFPADELLEFVLAACRPRRAGRGAAGGAAAAPVAPAPRMAVPGRYRALP